jgi:hypothetical protein
MALPGIAVEPGQPLAIELPEAFVVDAGGILSLMDAQGLKVDGVSYLGGAASGWSTSFAT